MICKETTIVDKEGKKLGKRIWIWCPGCEIAHALTVASYTFEPTSVWQWNGDMHKPTFSPSLLCTGEKRCHSFITDGKIRFLNDCEHSLANQTVPLPSLPDWLANE